MRRRLPQTLEHHHAAPMLVLMYIVRAGGRCFLSRAASCGNRGMRRAATALGRPLSSLARRPQSHLQPETQEVLDGVLAGERAAAESDRKGSRMEMQRLKAAVRSEVDAHLDSLQGQLFDDGFAEARF